MPLEMRTGAEYREALRDGRSVRAVDLPDAIRSQAADPDAAAPDGCSTTLTLDLDDGLEALIQQIVESALELDSVPAIVAMVSAAMKIPRSVVGWSVGRRTDRGCRSGFRMTSSGHR